MEAPHKRLPVGTSKSISHITALFQNEIFHNNSMQRLILP